MLNQKRSKTAWKLRFEVLLVLLVLSPALLAPVLARHDPHQIRLDRRMQEPSFEFPLGTDAMGRCVLCRLLYAFRVTPVAALCVTLFSVAVGTSVGLFSGYYGGKIDQFLMRGVEGLLAFPSIGLALVLVAFLGSGLWTVALSLAAVHWAEYARIIRTIALALKQKAFVEAARAMSATDARIMICHILPNTLGPILVMATRSMGWSILSFSGLSFLGLGADPGTAEWGLMIGEGRFYLRTAPRLVTAPGLTIMLVVVLVNILGDSLRDRVGGNPGGIR
jgi:peptide/nickel transport system permease protein/nickel transport system permease protein